MQSATHFIPIFTCLISIAFASVLYRRWANKKSATYLLWWTIGALVFGLGTLTEALTALIGWNLVVFKLWYISGALLGGAPLAQGTVYLLFSKKTANIMTIVLVAYVAVAAICVALSPVNYALVEPNRLSGQVLVWSWARLFSPFVNTYALVFLAGGALWSAWKYVKKGVRGSRVIGNVLIAVGALLPGIGGSFTRLGHVEVLYVTEFIGIVLIWTGYRVMSTDLAVSIHASQQEARSI